MVPAAKRSGSLPASGEIALPGTPALAGGARERRRVRNPAPVVLGRCDTSRGAQYVKLLCENPVSTRRHHPGSSLTERRRDQNA